MKKRILMAMFVLLFVAVFATACSDNNKTNNNPEPDTGKAEEKEETPTAIDYGDTNGLKLPIVDEPVELTWMLVSDVQDLDNSFVVKEIEKRTGIKLKIQAYSPGTYGEKLSTVVASGQLPDIWHGLTVSQVNELGKKV